MDYKNIELTDKTTQTLKDMLKFKNDNMSLYTLKLIETLEEAISVTQCCKSDSELLNVFYNVGDKVTFDNKKAVVLWTSVNYLDIEIVGTNKILQGVHTSKVLPR